MDGIVNVCTFVCMCMIHTSQRADAAQTVACLLFDFLHHKALSAGTPQGVHVHAYVSIYAYVCTSQWRYIRRMNSIIEACVCAPVHIAMCMSCKYAHSCFVHVRLRVHTQIYKYAKCNPHKIACDCMCVRSNFSVSVWMCMCILCTTCVCMYKCTHGDRHAQHFVSACQVWQDII
jgi:hypothetical protein